MIQLPNYELIKVIGSGAFGYVFEAYDYTNQQKVALKRIQKVGKNLSREFHILDAIKDCNYVVKMLDVYFTKTDDDKLIQNIVFEYMESNLESLIGKHIKQQIRISEQQIKEIAYQILKGLDYIHNKGIAHRDLKPNNILINKEGSVKICDFGAAKFIDQKGKNTPYIVSRYYRAPELILCITNYNCKIDMWSFGCILGELILNKPLFQGKTEGDQLFTIFRLLGSPNKEEFEFFSQKVPFDSRMFEEFYDYERQELIKDFKHLQQKELFIDLLFQCFKYCPDQRISANEALNHPLFEGLEKIYK